MMEYWILYLATVFLASFTMWVSEAQTPLWVKDPNTRPMILLAFLPIFNVFIFAMCLVMILNYYDVFRIKANKAKKDVDEG